MGRIKVRKEEKRETDLGLVQGNDHGKNSDSETANEATSHEHAEVDGAGLDGASDDGDDGSELDGPLSANLVGGVPWAVSDVDKNSPGHV